MSTLFDQTTEEPMTTALVERPQVDASNPLAILQLAIQQGADPGTLRELMELQREFAKDRAAEAFSTSLTAFQRKCKFVAKEREAVIRSSKGEYRYNFASFDDVMRQAGPALDECGLAVSFSTTAIEKGIRVTCRIRHGIHFEDHTLDVPVPAMNVNDTQRYGAALSYAKRYALCAALNIVVTDDTDDDGASAYEVITEEEANELDELMIRLVERDGEGERTRFKRFFEVENLADIPAERFEEARNIIGNKLRGARNANR